MRHLFLFWAANGAARRAWVTAPSADQALATFRALYPPTQAQVWALLSTDPIAHRQP